MDWRLCFIADAEAAGERDVLNLIRGAVRGGATLIQLRGKNWSTREFLRNALRTAEFLKEKGIPFIINDRVDIALACDADGVHLGREDIPLPYARTILGRSKIIGGSAETAAEALHVEKEGADYLGAAPVFFTASKGGIPPGFGLEGLRVIRDKVKIPILAVGGLHAGNVAEVMACGVDGVAVISAVSGAAEPSTAARKLRKAIDQALESRRRKGRKP